MDEVMAVCDRTVVRIMSKTNGVLRLESLTPAEETVVLVYHVIGLIGNAGLVGFLSEDFDEDPACNRITAAFHRIGATQAASLLRESVSKFDALAQDAAKDSRANLPILQELHDLDDRFDCLECETLGRLKLFIDRHIAA